jgi:hypothetical protein
LLLREEHPPPLDWSSIEVAKRGLNKSSPPQEAHAESKLKLRSRPSPCCE